MNHGEIGCKLEIHLAWVVSLSQSGVGGTQWGRRLRRVGGYEKEEQGE